MKVSFYIFSFFTDHPRIIMNPILNTNSFTRLRTMYVHRKKRVCCAPKRCFSMLIYFVYVLVNLWTIVQVVVEDNSEARVFDLTQTLILWNIVHTFSLFPEICIGCRERRLLQLRSVCTMIGSIIQSVYWSLYSHFSFSLIACVAYAVCSVLFILELFHQKSVRSQVMQVQPV